MAKTLREQLIGTWKLVSYVEKPTDEFRAFLPDGNGTQRHHHVYAGRLYVGSTGTSGKAEICLRRLVQGNAGGDQGRGVRRLFGSISYDEEKQHLNDQQLNQPRVGFRYGTRIGAVDQHSDLPPGAAKPHRHGQGLGFVIRHVREQPRIAIEEHARSAA